MTTVGKLLVIMNLAMSICFCGFAVAVYNAREDFWGRLKPKTQYSTTPGSCFPGGSLRRGSRSEAEGRRRGDGKTAGIDCGDRV
ncbi:MAG: hypothetical protein U1D30_21535 [Planctomycetota bacterium]